MRVVWSEGLFLTPQHLQLQDRLQRQELLESARTLTPWPWGVASVELDPAALTTQRLALISFCGCLPDGTVLRLPKPDSPLPPAIPVPATAERQGVYLVLPDRTGTSGARYAHLERTELDEYGAAEPATVTVAVHRPELWTGTSPPTTGVVCVKIAEIRRGERGEVVFDPSYSPPSLTLAAAKGVTAVLRELVVLIDARRRALAERLQAGVDGTFSLEVVRLHLQLMALGEALTRLTFCVDHDWVTPDRAFEDLCAAVGSLGAVAQPGAPPQPFPFDRDDLRGTFRAPAEALRRLLTVELKYNHLPIELRRQGPGRWRATLPGETLEGSGTLFLLVDGAPPGEAGALERNVKIAAPTDIETIVSKNLSALTLITQNTAPPNVPTRPGVQYLAIRRNGSLWRTVKAEEALEVHVPGPTSHSLSLVFVPGPGRM